MRYFVRQSDSPDFLEIEASSPLDAALAFSRRFRLPEGDRIVVQGDGTRHFLFKNGFVSEEGSSAPAPAASGPIVQTKEQIESGLVKELSRILSVNSFWIRTLAVLVIIAGVICIICGIVQPLIPRDANHQIPMPLMLLVGVFMLAVGALYIWFSRMLFRTASAAVSAEKSGAKAELAKSIGSMSTLLRVNGILALVVAILYAVGICLILFASLLSPVVQ